MSEEKKQPLVYPLFSKARGVFEVSNQQTHKLFSVLGPRRWNELPAASGPHSRPPASTQDSKLTCSELTWTSQIPPHRPLLSVVHPGT